MVDDPQYANVNLPRFIKKPWDIVGRKRLPAGPGVELQAGFSRWIVTPVREPKQRCFFDLDTNRKSGWPKSLPPFEEIGLDSPQLLAWAREEGFDMVGISHTPEGASTPLNCLQPIDMNVWRSTTEEHRNLKRAMAGKQAYPLSNPVKMMVPLREVKRPYDYEYGGAAFLYVTRGGTAGLIRMTGQVTDTNTNVQIGKPSSPDDQFSPIGFYRGAKISFKAMTDASTGQEDRDKTKKPIEEAVDPLGRFIEEMEATRLAKTRVLGDRFLVAPVTTDLQRNLLGSSAKPDQTVSLCVLVDAGPFDSPRKGSRLQECARQHTTFGVAWNDALSRARDAAAIKGDASESATKTEDLRIYQVETFLSHFLMNADCVVDYLPVVRDADGTRFLKDVLPCTTVCRFNRV